MEDNFIFTSENLLDNLDKLGPWSTYGLAVTAIGHYHPHVCELSGIERIKEEVRLTGENTWEYWIKRYHKEVGYKGEFNPSAVNQY